MFAIRYEPEATNKNLNAILSLIGDHNSKSIRLFASPTQEDASFGQNDGSGHNLPLVSALVEYQIPSISLVYIVFDGAFLSAQRDHIKEVEALVEKSVDSGKTYYSKIRAPFTSSLQVGKAVQKLMELELTPLNSNTKNNYLKLLR